MNHKIFKLSLILLGVLLLMAFVIASRPTPALADVNVGDVIDSSNVQKIKGMVPDAIYEYVQKGWITMKIGKLNFDPADIMSNEFKEHMKTNNGRYGISPKGELIDKKTGEQDPMDLIGVPFPTIDVKDPMAGIMMLANHAGYLNCRGNMAMSATLYFVGQKMERFIRGPQIAMSFRNTSKNIALQASGKQFGAKPESTFIMKVTDPYELNGLATMTYSFADNTPDKVFAYVPALRRTRVLTAAARSDSMFGTDYALDDAAGGFMGKPRDFNCKYIKSQDMLARFNNPNVIELSQKPDGTLELSKNRPNTVWGFQTPGWKGKAWASTGDIWVVRKGHVIECMAKDPYYNYGKFELWYDPACFTFFHKTIWDKAGKRWKVMNIGVGAYSTKDGSLSKIDAAFGDWIYDEQRDHATSIDEFNTREKKMFNAPISANDFNQGGLAKFAK